MEEMTLKDIQTVSLEILETVHHYCVENGIRYSLAYGTLIGAVRHNGFIPWDDDMDIMMPRPDYDKFCRSFKAQGFEVVSRANRKDCLIPFARVCETRKTYVKTMVPWIRKQGDLGIWIDLFPVDSAPDDNDLFQELYDKVNHCHVRSLKARRKLRPFSADYPLKYNLNTLKKKLFAVFGHKPEFYLDAMDQLIRTTYDNRTCHLTQLGYPAKKEYFSNDVFDGYHLTSFENSSFFIIDGYDRLLQMEYGDYMKLPPEDQRKPQQDYIRFYWKDVNTKKLESTDL